MPGTAAVAETARQGRCRGRRRPPAVRGTPGVPRPRTSDSDGLNADVSTTWRRGQGGPGHRGRPLDAGLAVEAAPLTPTWPWHATAVGRARLGPRARRRPPLGEHARPPPGKGGVSGRRARGAAPWRSPSSRPSRTPRRRKGVPDESGTEADEGFPAPGRTGGKSQPWKPPGPQSGTKCGTKSEGSLKTLGTKGQ